MKYLFYRYGEPPPSTGEDERAVEVFDCGWPSDAAKNASFPYTKRRDLTGWLDVAWGVREGDTSGLIDHSAKIYDLHPVLIFRQIRETKACLDHVSDALLTDMILGYCARDYGWNSYYVSLWDRMPRGNAEQIELHLAWRHGARCSLCRDIKMDGCEEVLKHGICDPCLVKQRRTVKTRQQIDAAHARLYHKLQRERNEAFEKKQQEYKLKKARRQLLEKAAYKALEEMGLLKTIEDRLDGEHRTLSP